MTEEDKNIMSEINDARIKLNKLLGKAASSGIAINVTSHQGEYLGDGYPPKYVLISACRPVWETW